MFLTLTFLTLHNSFDNFFLILFLLQLFILLTFSTLLTFPPFQKAPSLFKSAQIMMELFDIPTNPEISIIIQISLSLSFQKGMILDVCPDIPDNLNITNILDIQIRLDLCFGKDMTLDVCLYLLTFLKFSTFLTFLTVLFYFIIIVE